MPDLKSGLRLVYGVWVCGSGKIVRLGGSDRQSRRCGIRPLPVGKLSAIRQPTLPPEFQTGIVILLP